MGKIHFFMFLKHLMYYFHPVLVQEMILNLGSHEEHLVGTLSFIKGITLITLGRNEIRQNL